MARLDRWFGGKRGLAVNRLFPDVPLVAGQLDEIGNLFSPALLARDGVYNGQDCVFERLAQIRPRINDPPQIGGYA
jgi:hypothetical protein